MFHRLPCHQFHARLLQVACVLCSHITVLSATPWYQQEDSHPDRLSFSSLDRRGGERTVGSAQLWYRSWKGGYACVNFHKQISSFSNFLAGKVKTIPEKLNTLPTAGADNHSNHTSVSEDAPISSVGLSISAQIPEPNVSLHWQHTLP